MGQPRRYRQQHEFTHHIDGRTFTACSADGYFFDVFEHGSVVLTDITSRGNVPLAIADHVRSARTH